MDIKILDSWLKDYLKTTALPEKIGECLSLCGPSIEGITKLGSDTLYSIEVTTNRVDSASVFGIAREAAAILPRFGIKAKLVPPKIKSGQQLVGKVSYLEASVDKNLCSRFTAVLIKNVNLAKSPMWLINRLEAAGIRTINNIVDISNYLMLEFGQPVHTFDYDKIRKSTMSLRASRNGEQIVTLDGKHHLLPGGDIVIEDGDGRLIDLAGIMGAKNSSIDENTKNVLLFVQKYNPINIRQTSMRLAHRTDAGALFEKDLDAENIETTIRRGVDLFQEICSGKSESEILDFYPNHYKQKTIDVSLQFIRERLGIFISPSETKNILGSLGFQTTQGVTNEIIQVRIPSYRAKDINIPEDIVEEVARLYGYHNIPSQVVSGPYPKPLENAPFKFESRIKELLKGWCGIEVYTPSMVAKNKVALTETPALKLRNPLGLDSEYLRVSLAPSLADAADENIGKKEKFMLFEVSNVYPPKPKSLPQEKMSLGVIFHSYSYREAKGILEGLLELMGIEVIFKPLKLTSFKSDTATFVEVKRQTVGQLGILKAKDYIYFELDTAALQNLNPKQYSYKPLPKYPAQIEDLTVNMPDNIYLQDVILAIKKSNPETVSIELVDLYENNRTLRISYQNPHKTLTDKEVEKVRNKIKLTLREKYNVKIVD